MFKLEKQLACPLRGTNGDLLSEYFYSYSNLRFDIEKGDSWNVDVCPGVFTTRGTFVFGSDKILVRDKPVSL